MEMSWVTNIRMGWWRYGINGPRPCQGEVKGIFRSLAQKTRNVHQTPCSGLAEHGNLTPNFSSQPDTLQGLTLLTLLYP